MSDFLKEVHPGKVVWRFAGTMRGAQCVTMDGGQQMPELFADS